MKTSKKDSHANAWSNYWHHDFLTTFVDHQDENYTGEVKQYWTSVFSEIVSEQSIVDLAAGNGALLALAKEYFSDKDVTVAMTAIDIANLSNSSFYRENQEIEVLDKTDLASISISDNTVDLCISQFGFEYSNTQESCKEVFRILKPNGRLHLVMHHASSYISLHSRSAIEQIRLCRNSKLTQTTEKLLQRLQKLRKTHRENKSDIKANELRDHFNKMAERLIQYGEKLPDADHIRYFLNELSNLFSEKSKDLTLAQKLIIIKKIESDSDNYHLRMSSMLDASMDQKHIEKLKAELVSSGFEVTSMAALNSSGQDYAWLIEAIKR